MPDNHRQETDIRPVYEPAERQQEEVRITPGSDEPAKRIQWSPDVDIKRSNPESERPFTQAAANITDKYQPEQYRQGKWRC